MALRGASHLTGSTVLVQVRIVRESRGGIKLEECSFCSGVEVQFAYLYKQKWDRHVCLSHSCLA